MIGVIVYEFSRQMLLAEQTLALVAPLITDGSEDKKGETVEHDRGRPEKAGRGYDGTRDAG